MNSFDEFWVRSLFAQIYTVPPARRREYQWRINHEAWAILRGLNYAGAPLYSVPLQAHLPLTLLGYPVELDDASLGAIFEPRQP